jgi:hypothetical protein
MHAGYLRRTLVDFLKALESHNSPLYTFTPTPLSGDDYATKVQVTIYEKATENGAHRIHHAIAPTVTTQRRTL